MGILQRWQLKQSAKEQLRGNWGQMALKYFLTAIIPMGILWVVTAVVIACFAVSSVVPEMHYRFGLFRMHEFGLNGLAAVGGILMIVLYLGAAIVGLALEFGYTDSCIKLRCGEQTGINVIFGRFSMLPKILMYTLLILVICIPYFVITALASAFANFLTGILSLAAVVVYIYVILRISMSVFIMLENPYTTAWTAIKQSWNLMSGHCGRLFVLNLSFLGWMLLAGLSCGIGMLWLSPYMTMTTVNFYYNLKEVSLYGAEQL